jgi:hypothetical protein
MFDQQTGDTWPVDEFHRVIIKWAVTPLVEDADDIRMTELLECGDFKLKPLDAFYVAGDVRRKKLHGDLIPRFIKREIDDAHPAMTKLPDQLIGTESFEFHGNCRLLDFNAKRNLLRGQF